MFKYITGCRVTAVCHRKVEPLPSLYKRYYKRFQRIPATIPKRIMLKKGVI